MECWENIANSSFKFNMTVFVCVYHDYTHTHTTRDYMHICTSHVLFTFGDPQGREVKCTTAECCDICTLCYNCGDAETHTCTLCNNCRDAETQCILRVL